MNLFSAGVYKHFRSLSLAWNADLHAISSTSNEVEGLPISILMGLCKGNLWPKIILIMICLDISSLFFGLYYDFSHCIYIGIYISFDINKAPRSCLATAGRAPEAVPFQTFKCMLHIFRRIFQKSLISYRDFHAISEHGPSIPGNSRAQ